MVKLKSNRRIPKAPLSAMSDIGFIMLVFIMLLSLINYRKEVKIEYPEAQSVERTESLHELEIWIKESGGVFVDGENVDTSRLEHLIAQAFTEHPDVRIHILADRNTPYMHIDGVVQILQLMQHRVVSFVVKENL